MDKRPFIVFHLSTFISIVLLSLWVATPAKAVPEKASFVALDRIVARVNGDIITSSELGREASLIKLQLQAANRPLPPESQLRKHVLDKMVLESLQLQVAKTQGIETDENELNQRLEAMAKSNNSTVEQMRTDIENEGLSFKEYRRNLQKDLTLTQVRQRQLSSQISISKAEVDSFLNSPSGQSQLKTEYQLGHILLTLPSNPTTGQIESVKQKAEGLIKLIKNGTPFESVAILHSQGQHAIAGGDLGWRKLAQLPTLFVDQVPLMRTGDVSFPIKASGSFHIIILKDKRMPEELGSNPERLRMQVQNFLYERKFEEASQTWLTRLKDDAEIILSLANDQTLSS